MSQSKKTPIPAKKINKLLRGGRGRVEGRDDNTRSYMSSIYRSKRVDPNDKDWEKRMKELMKRKIRKAMKEKNLLNQIMWL